ncbi:TPA: hypothetical protein JBF89_13155 [Legionella pneumophila]|nr:hypothetical protein [Legionella pneumophila]HAU0349912.1 hypothetical protein [Legionella pneumophila]HAU0353403.1 hypothetical protein [Legionella pneumophila]HAU0359492.1 hypothetical protein [Legionella pneumophila]HAU0368049.1 hypothetical protein [Legionella pneumophila]
MLGSEQIRRLNKHKKYAVSLLQQGRTLEAISELELAQNYCVYSGEGRAIPDGEISEDLEEYNKIAVNIAWIECIGHSS